MYTFDNNVKLRKETKELIENYNRISGEKIVIKKYKGFYVKVCEKSKTWWGASKNQKELRKSLILDTRYERLQKAESKNESGTVRGHNLFGSFYEGYRETLEKLTNIQMDKIEDIVSSHNINDSKERTYFVDGIRLVVSARDGWIRISIYNS